MRNFKLTLEYDGTEFSGWQTQAQGFRTVQSHLEEKLERIFKKKVHCQASGRTDSGVHALGQTAHFKIETTMPTTLIYKAINSFLDKDLTVINIEEVPIDFHAQKDVKSKTYRYSILNRKSPSALWRNRAYFYPDSLDLAAMRKAAIQLKGNRDYKSFQSAAERSKIKNTVRNVSGIKIIKDGDLIHIDITSDGFLYKMVRNIVGLLIAVGCGDLPLSDVVKIVNAKGRTQLAPRTAPSHGLYLVSVRY